MPRLSTSLKKLRLLYYSTALLVANCRISSDKMPQAQPELKKVRIHNERQPSHD